MNIVTALLYIVLAAFVGGLLAGVDRVISARMQGRQGPPLLQPFYDVLKLFSKEAIVVNDVQNFFIIGFLVFVIFTGAIFFAGGDLLLAIFALTLASIFLVMGAYSSNSPYSTIGAERELIQMMSYEPMLLAMAIGQYMHSGTFNIGQMIQSKTMAIGYLPGVFLGFVFILTIKLRKSPFDVSTSHHAHQEVVKGLTTEFSGRNLALMEIAHWYENVFFLGIVALFFLNASAWSWPLAIVVSLLVFFLEILIDNSSARVKWQAMLKTTWILTFCIGFLNLVIINILK